MSLVPLLVDLAREFDDYEPNPISRFDDDFGFGICPEDIFRPRASSSLVLLNPRRSRYSPYNNIRSLIPRGHRDTINQNLISVPNVGKDGFQVCMDVSHFKPNELTVKTVENQIVVEGKHEEREDEHGMIKRQFVRKYSLPKGYDAKDVVSTISSDGVLTVKAPPPPKSIKNKERIVQIQQTGPAHLNVKDTAQSEGSLTDKKTAENNKMDTSGK